MRKKLDILIIILFIAILGLSFYLIFHNDTIYLKNIVLDKKEINLYIDDSDTINVTFVPEDATNKKIIWKSNNPSIANVKNGVVTGYNVGETDVIASTQDGNISEKCHIKVKIRNVEKIKIESDNITLRLGEKKSLKVDIEPENATYKKLLYQSSDKNVVSIDANGNMLAKKYGKAVITVKSVSQGKEAKCNVIVSSSAIMVNSVTLDKTSAHLNIGKSLSLKVTISPGNANNKNITWKSSNTSIATVDKIGVVKAIKDGVVTITALNEESGKRATCTVMVRANPIVPINSTSYKYEGTTLKYYVQNNNSYYLTYIWMDDPYNQIKKLESTVAQYGKLMSDDELISSGKKSLRKTVGNMLNSYINNGMISKSKALIAYNASGFFDKSISAWKPPSDYYNLKTNSWFVLTDGKLMRNRIYDEIVPQGTIVGIAPSGELKIYSSSIKTEEERKKKSETILADQIKNTWSFGPVLIRDGKVITKNQTSAQRQEICQINTNNYVMLTTIHSKSLVDVSSILKNIGCKTAFNFDGGGSTSMFYKNINSPSVTKIKCGDGSSNYTCRAVVDGIYFIEK